MTREQGAKRGLKGFARLLLAMTTLAPVLIVWSAATWETSPRLATVATLVAVVMVLMCVGLLRIARRQLQSEILRIAKPRRMDKEALAFLITYALPLVAPAETAAKVIPLAIFVVLVCIVVSQLQLLQINPLLAIFGYHFYEFDATDGDTFLIVSPSRSMPVGEAIEARRLGPGLFLHVTA